MTSQDHHLSTLQINSLSKAYGQKNVIRDVSFSIKQGEIIGLLGPNGAGKTTSFYMVVGLIRADTGRILIDDKQIQNLPIHERAKLGISYLPQEVSVFRNLNVEENIQAVLELQKDSNGKAYSKAEVKRRLEQLLIDLHITHIRTSAANSLSGGERRRVEIARALATNPKFILLDEPFAGIDPNTIEEIKRLIIFLKQQNIGTLITDHNASAMLRICDRAYIINGGYVIASGSPAEIIHDKEVIKVYLGSEFHL